MARMQEMECHHNQVRIVKWWTRQWNAAAGWWSRTERSRPRNAASNGQQSDNDKSKNSSAQQNDTGRKIRKSLQRTQMNNRTK